MASPDHRQTHRPACESDEVRVSLGGSESGGVCQSYRVKLRKNEYRD